MFPQNKCTLPGEKCQPFMFPLCLLKESYTYKDPITEFVECLYVNFDFDSAQRKLRECESVSFQMHHLHL